MSPDEVALKSVAEIVEISKRQAEPAAERMSQITDTMLRYWNILLSLRLANKTDLVVPYGPFAGMRCMVAIAGSSIVPRLVGCYEAELHDTISEFARRRYQRVINIGCCEGYYAVGLARLLPNAHVYAFDSEPYAQNLCRSLAELNQVADRVTIMGKCTAATLQDLAQPGSLIFCDCEGEELNLLDPVAAPNLLLCDILVELHDYVHPETSSTFETRFHSTHTRRVIPQSQRDPAAYPILDMFNDFERTLAVCEFRPGPTPWALFLSNITR